MRVLAGRRDAQRVPWALRAMAVLLLAASAAAADDAAESFAIYEFRILGSTAIPRRDLERAVYPLLGPDRTITDVEQAREAIAAVYREKGFGAVTVDIPEQDVVDGVVRLQVTEGRLGEVRVTGARYFSAGRILTNMPSLRQGEVLDLPALQADLATLNRQSRDRTIAPVLRAGNSPGTVDLELKVKDDLPVSGQLEVNNRYTADTSPTRVSTTLGYDNLFQKFHSLSFQYQVAPEEPDESRVMAATYLAPVGRSGNALAAYAVRTDSEVSTVGALSVLGAGNIYGLRYVMPIAGSSGWYHGLTVGADYKDFDEDVVLEDGLDSAPITYVNWSLAYSASRVTDTATSTLGLTANSGLDGVVNDAAEFAYKRYGATPNYYYLRGSLRHVHSLPWPVRIALRLDGQASIEPLIANEQFAIGGADSVRGYLEAEELGDTGFSGSLELRTVSLVPYVGDRFQDLYALFFYDVGLVSLVDALPGQAGRADLASLGLGLRVAAFDGFEAVLDWAYPLVPGAYTLDGDSRLHFRVLYAF